MKNYAKKQAIGALVVFGFLTAAAPALAQAALLGDAKQTSADAFSLSTAGPGETPHSGVDALWIDDLEAQLSLSPLTLGDNALEGSAFQKTFTVAAGSVASFDWTLNTDAFDAEFTDRAFVAINGQLNWLASAGAAPLHGSFSHMFTSAGTYTFAVGVVDVNDVTGVSRLDIDNVAVSAVPEPSSLALMLAGLVGVGTATRKRLNSKA
ncbi:MAG: PEP-CTERM sorting domain-containing protein [Burkholderiales bacterium]|nr:PEP-CTERM sorting domain-containing protein [Burkholderiales bacterium]